MKALKYILFILLIAIIGTVIYIEVQPNEFAFSRSRTIEAPSEVVFNKVNNYKDWPSFSPWIEQEPNAELTYGEKTVGADASYGWKGEILGEGKMTTLAVDKNKSISQKIQFIKPFESESDIDWTFETTQGGTKVTWGMKGKQDFMTKMYTAFVGSIEEMTAPDFDRGLFKLDSVIKVDMKKYTITVNGMTQHSGGFYLYNTTSCRIDELPIKMKDLFAKISLYAIQNNITFAGAPFTNYLKWDENNNATIFSCCIPTTDRVITNESDILTGELTPFKAVKTTLKGDYSNLKEAWETAMKYITNNVLEFTENGPMLETYITDPANTPNPADWVTEIYIAVK